MTEIVSHSPRAAASGSVSCNQKEFTFCTLFLRKSSYICQGAVQLWAGVEREAFRRVLTALPEDPSSVPSIHVRRYTTAIVPAPGDLVPSSGFFRYLHTCGHIHMRAHTHIHERERRQRREKENFFNWIVRKWINSIQYNHFLRLSVRLYIGMFLRLWIKYYQCHALHISHRGCWVAPCGLTCPPIELLIADHMWGNDRITRKAVFSGQS